MADRQRFRVTPSGQGWALQGGGQNRTFSTKQEAVRQGRQAARGTGMAQLVVHKRDGSIQTEYTYGSDPRRTKG